MGLKERQQIDNASKSITCSAKCSSNQRLQTYTGMEMAYDVDWSSFEQDLEACYSIANLLNFIGNACGVNAVSALQDGCSSSRSKSESSPRSARTRREVNKNPINFTKDNIDLSISRIFLRKK
ncbi:MAG: hypothetical protein ACFB8W_10430 [Elainellaceae cyanobacterium]